MTETYNYQGPEGRLSSRRLVVTDLSGGFGGAKVFEQAFRYDSLGNLLSQAYPHCQGEPCATVEPARTVSYGYTRGLLTSIPGYASSVMYHGNGALASVVHGNGTTDAITRDPHWLTRPAELKTLGPGAGVQWNSGTYAYGGSGNIQSIGEAGSRPVERVPGAG